MYSRSPKIFQKSGTSYFSAPERRNYQVQYRGPQYIRRPYKIYSPGRRGTRDLCTPNVFRISSETDIQPIPLPNSLHQIFLYKLVVTKLVQKVYAAWTCIAVVIRASPNQSAPQHPISLRLISVLSFQLWLDLANDRFPSCFQTKMLYKTEISSPPCILHVPPPQQ